jgi:homoserine dehydrogenase
VDNEFNGVIVDGEFSGEQFLKGKGAGGHPTGAAVLSDISALSYGYKYEYKKHEQHNHLEFTNDVSLKIYFRYEEESDLKQLQFNSISEKYSGGNYNYVIGNINLNELIRNQELLKKKKLFVASIGDEIAYQIPVAVNGKKELAFTND